LNCPSIILKYWLLQYNDKQQLRSYNTVMCLERIRILNPLILFLLDQIIIY
jgi:hypothetical protein